MEAFQVEFIDLARRYEVLKFGEFTLKSCLLYTSDAADD